MNDGDIEIIVLVEKILGCLCITENIISISR